MRTIDGTLTLVKLKLVILCLYASKGNMNLPQISIPSTPYMVIAIRKTQIIAQNSHGHKIPRNISHFKHVVKQQQDYDTDIDDDKQDNDEQRKFGNEQGQN